MRTPDKLTAQAWDACESAAAEWLARRDAGLTATEEREFGAWLNADPGHAEAWRAIEVGWRAFDLPRRDGLATAMIGELKARQRRRRWRVLAGSASTFTAAAAAVALIFLRPQPHHGVTPATASAVAGILVRSQVQQLPDGSRAELNGGAELAVEFSAMRRSVRLLRGEAHFAVEKDPARPFVVSAGGLEVRAVGTAFAVKVGAQGVDVLVTEGRVAVAPPQDAASAPERSAAIEVDAGARLSVPTHPAPAEQLRPMPVATAAMAQLLGWRGPRLELAGTALGAAIAVLNRENDVQISIEDAELATMRLSGVFRADNAAGFVELLELHYGVAVERRGAKTFVLRKPRG